MIHAKTLLMKTGEIMWNQLKFAQSLFLGSIIFISVGCSKMTSAITLTSDSKKVLRGKDVGAFENSVEETEQSRSGWDATSLNPPVTYDYQFDQSGNSTSQTATTSGAASSSGTVVGSQATSTSSSVSTSGTTTVSGTAVSVSSESQALDRQVLSREKLNWTLTEVKVVNESVIKAIAHNDPRTLLDNSLNVESRSLVMIIDRGEGMFCKTNLQSEVRQNEVYVVSEIIQSIYEDDKFTKNVTVSFVNSNDRQSAFQTYCKLRGDTGLKEYQNNFKDVLGFKEQELIQKSSRRVSKYDYAKVNEMMSYIKITNALDLEKTNVKRLHDELEKKLAAQAASGQQQKVELPQSANNKYAVPVFVDGHLEMNSGVAQEAVLIGRSPMACHVAGVPKGQLKNGDYYKLIEVSDGQRDSNHGVLVKNYYYSSGDESEFAITCFMNFKTNIAEFLYVFGDAIEFGARPARESQPE